MDQATFHACVEAQAIASRGRASSQSVSLAAATMVASSKLAVASDKYSALTTAQLRELVARKQAEKAVLALKKPAGANYKEITGTKKSGRIIKKPAAVVQKMTIPESLPDPFPTLSNRGAIKIGSACTGSQG